MSNSQTGFGRILAFWAVVSISVLLIPVNKADAACPATANISFGKTNYNVNDTIVLNGSDTSGTWTLCIYNPDGLRRVMTSNNTSTSTKANVAGAWKGILRNDANCPMNYSATADCQASTMVAEGSTSGGGTTATTEDCAGATVSFDKASYAVGDTVTLNGSNTSGTWSLCIYDPDGSRVRSTLNSTVSSTSVAADVAGEWKGVLTPNGSCPTDYASSHKCRAVAQVGTTSGGETTTGGGSGSGGSTGSISITNPIETDDFTILVENVLKWLLGIAGSLALLMIIIGGVLYMTANGDEQKAAQGKRIVTWTLGGLVVILLSYSIIVVIEDIFVN